MRYEGRIYRPPSEAHSLILQATIGCSWNACTYCDMYREKSFRVRDLEETLADIQMAREVDGEKVQKVFVADGDALILDFETWSTLLEACHEAFPNLRRVSCYATAMNILEKPPEELASLRNQGLDLLYIGPESGDDPTLKRIAKGANHAAHVEAAEKAKAAGIKLSAIFLLGVGGLERNEIHALESARLASAMDPRFLSLLTLTIVPETPIAKLASTNRFHLPNPAELLKELRAFVAHCNPTDAIFRTNHASNYLPISGRLPRDRDRILEQLDRALDGQVPLRPEWNRGL